MKYIQFQVFTVTRIWISSCSVKVDRNVSEQYAASILRAEISVAGLWSGIHPRHKEGPQEGKRYEAWLGLISMVNRNCKSKKWPFCKAHISCSPFLLAWTRTIILCN
jgi:hypothetical protein